MSAARRRNKVVILGSLSMGEVCLTSALRARLMRRLRAAFSLRATGAVVAAVVSAMTWHNLTAAPDAAVAVDAAVAMPWLAVFAVRTSRAAARMHKGGEL